MTEPHAHGELIGSSALMRAVFEALAICANTDVSVLVEGEPGTGKEGAARAIHAHSKRKNGPLVRVDCGAEAKRLGSGQARAFAEAEGGTLFLDEVAALDLALQDELVSLLERRSVRSEGLEETSGVRVIATTHHDLRGAREEGRFRPDLYFRLSALRVVLPPLSARTDDIPSLALLLLDRLGASPAQRQRFTEPAFIASLAAAPWPGNVRELFHYLERCLVMDKELPMIELDTEREAPAYSSPPSGQPIDASVSYEQARKQAIADFERNFLEALLDRSHGNVSRAARDAGMDRVYLHRLIRRHALR